MNAYLVVPATTDVGAVFDHELIRHLRADHRAVEIGVIVLMPKDVTPLQLMCATSLWPELLRDQVGVTRIAIILGIAAYSIAEPILRACVRTAAAHRLELKFFHEAQLETDAVAAWCERRAPRRRRVTTDALVKLGERYIERNDIHSAHYAYKLAERGAEDLVDPEVLRNGTTVKQTDAA